MIGAVKPVAGTSVVLSAWGTGVVHPAATSANTAAEAELKNRFIKITRLRGRRRAVLLSLAAAKPNTSPATHARSDTGNTDRAVPANPTANA
jgi:hypothetical protein